MLLNMWKTLSFPFKHSNGQKFLLDADLITKHQIRSTFILKRRWPPGLHKKNATPHKLRGRNFVYDLVEDTNTRKQQNIDVILTGFVDGLGSRGDVVTVKSNYAYNKLLLPKLAVYKTLENLEKYSVPDENDEKREIHSSPFAVRTVQSLSNFLLSVVMSKENPWRIEPWHIKTSFRKAGYHVPIDVITLPEHTIDGPDLSKEGKHFYVTITINGLEKTKVKCILHHWSTNPNERLPYVFEYWKLQSESMFPENNEV